MTVGGAVGEVTFATEGVVAFEGTLVAVVVVPGEEVVAGTAVADVVTGVVVVTPTVVAVVIIPLVETGVGATVGVGGLAPDTGIAETGTGNIRTRSRVQKRIWVKNAVFDIGDSLVPGNMRLMERGFFVSRSPAIRCDKRERKNSCPRTRVCCTRLPGGYILTVARMQ